jgi:hypothetical protein
MVAMMFEYAGFGIKVLALKPEFLGALLGRKMRNSQYNKSNGVRNLN